MELSSLKSKFFSGGALLVLLLTVYLVGREVNKKYQIRREIQSLQTDIQEHQSKNEELLKLIDYLKTREYQERQARTLLNLQKPGEFAVALPPQPEEQLEAQAGRPETDLKSNLRLWWDYFFGPK